MTDSDYNMLQKYYYYIPSVILITVIYFLINPSRLTLPFGQVLYSDETKPEQPQPLSSSEWNDKHLTFIKLYSNTSPDKRKDAIELIDTQLYNRLSVSDIKYAVATMKFLLEVLSLEENEAVVISTKALLAKLLIQANYIEWMSQNYKKFVTKEPTKLRFINTLGITVKSSHNDFIFTTLSDLAGKEESFSSVRLSALGFLARNFPSKSIDIFMNFISDADINISKSALNYLAELKTWEKIDCLIELLAGETRKEIKDEIGRTLEKITNEQYGTDVNAWQKWVKQNHINAVLLQVEADAAIRKGIDFLTQFYTTPNQSDGELLFYTMIKSGVKVPEEVMEKFLDYMLSKKLESTYRVTLLAMCLNTLDKNKYLGRLIQCAEFLLANQTNQGNWRYGSPIEIFINTDSPKPIGPTDKTSTRSVKKIKMKLPPRRKDTDYDNSCTQYALLGLRACADADIEIPQKVWADAEKHLLNSQNPDGGWYYRNNGSSYGSMTAGGLGGLAICKYYLNKNIADDKSIKRSVEWLINNFTVRENPKNGDTWHYYYLYGLERAGTLLNIEVFGKREWYFLGAQYLLREQKQDGSWNSNIQDTCFAILFLRRATKPFKIVITGENK